MEQPDFLVIGQVLRPHGVRGEIRVQVITDYPERFNHLDEVLLARDLNPDEDEGEFYDVERARLHQGDAVIKLAEVDDRDAAELLRGQYLLVPMEDAVPLEEGEYYVYQLIGLEMVTEAGEVIGTVRDMLETGANDVYVVDSEQYGEVLIPAIPDVIKDINLETGRITITPLPGLLTDIETDNS